MSLLLVITFTLMQPVSAGGMNFPLRFLFFSLHIFPTVYVAWKASGWLFNQTFCSKVSPWILLAIAGAISGVFLAPFSVFLEIIFGVVDYSVVPPKKLDYSMLSFTTELKQEWFAVVPKTTIFWPLINAMLTWELANKETETEENFYRENIENSATNEIIYSELTTSKNNTVNTQVSSSFINLLPNNIGSDIIYLRSEEHYLKVATVSGEGLIFYGLSNAIRDLERLGIEGFHVHRSYWVSRKHILRIEIESNGAFALMSNNRTIPISRRRVKEITSNWRKN